MRLIALLRTLRLSIKSTQWSVRRSSRRKGWLRSLRRSLLSKRPGESKWTSGSKTRWRSSRRSRKLSLILSMPIVRWKTGGGIRVLRQNAWLRTRSTIWCQRDLSLSQRLPMGSLLAHRWRESNLKKLVFCLARSRRTIWVHSTLRGSSQASQEHPQTLPGLSSLTSSVRVKNTPQIMWRSWKEWK